MKWHWFSTDTWAATKCNQILCKSNLWCSILMTTLLPVTLISGSYLFSFSEPKVVCIPQKGKLSIGIRVILHTTSTSVPLIWLNMYIFKELEIYQVSNTWIKCHSLKIALELQCKFICRESFRKGEDIRSDIYAELRISFGIFFWFYNLKEKYGNGVEIKSLLVLLWALIDVVFLKMILKEL